MPQTTGVSRRFPTGVFVACLVILAATIALGLFIAGHPGWSRVEAQIVYAVNRAHAPPLDVLALTINTVFGTQGAFVVGLALLVVVFALTRSPWSSLRAGLLLGLSWLVAALVKRIVQRERPDPSGLVHPLVPLPHSSSFPSGHTAFAAALVCAVVLSIAVRRARRASLVVGAVLVVVVGCSRVYLGVHYPTDVLAAMIVTPAVAIAWALLLARVGVFASAPYIGTDRPTASASES